LPGFFWPEFAHTFTVAVSVAILFLPSIKPFIG